MTSGVDILVTPKCTYKKELEKKTIFKQIKKTLVDSVFIIYICTYHITAIGRTCQI